MLQLLLYGLEATISIAFALDYCLRLLTANERRRYSHLGPLTSRLRWALSFEAVLDACSCFPFLLDATLLSPGVRTIPSLAWLRIFRVALLFRTARWAAAVRTVGRVCFAR